MKYRVEHQTSYTYTNPAILSCNDVCLDLRTTAWQHLLSSIWDIDPQPQTTQHHLDYFGNAWRTLSFEQALDHLTLTVCQEVEVLERTESAENAPLGANLITASALSPADLIHPYLWKSPMVETGPAFATYAAPSFPQGRALLDCVMDLTLRIFSDFTYAPATTSIGTTTLELLQTRHGVCQDYAHFELAVLRSIGIAARYVSGYLNTVPKLGQEKVYGADASHAWISVYDNQKGWVDFDPTNGIAVNDGHITIGWGRDYGDVTPLRGVLLGGGTQTLKVMVDVRNLPDTSTEKKA